MAGIAPNPRQQLDGVSITPALHREGSLPRQAIFCHFPHTVLATYNLPSTSVRQGDWKLIRFYGEGADRAPDYALYNLREDIGETVNLADTMPRRVRELDDLITRHLEATGSVVPVPNPAYAPGTPIPWKPRG